MVKCLDCGNSGEWDDRKKFMQHGYPKDFSISLSCLNCGSYNLRNSLSENFLFYGCLAISGVFMLLIALAIVFSIFYFIFI